MLHGTKKFVAGGMMTAVALMAAQAQADSLIDATYKYADATPGGSVLTCCTGDTEDVRIGAFGDGLLNNGLIGDQTYMETVGNPREDGFAGAWFAYQSEGGTGTVTKGAYYPNGQVTVVFDLGSLGTNLTDVVIDFSSNPAVNFNNPSTVTISDGVNADVVFNAFPAESDGATGRGQYQSSTIDISNLSGQFITLAFDHNGAEWGGLNEISFFRVPEPASIALLGLGGLMMLRRRA